MITALGLALLPGNALAQQKSLKDQLVGTWTLVSWEQDVPSGPKFQRFGANPKGYNIFDANGRSRRASFAGVLKTQRRDHMLF